MSAGEFERWREYYLISPFDDDWRIRKPMSVLMALTARNLKPAEYFEDMIRPRRPVIEGGHEFDGVDGEVIKFFRPKKG